MILRWEEEFEWNRYLCTNKHTTMNTFEQRLTALKFVKDNNFEIEGKTIFETAEEVFKWASQDKPLEANQNENDSTVVENEPIDEYGGAPIPKRNFTRVLDKIIPGWRNPVKPIVVETVLHGDKEEIAKVIDISEPFFDGYGNMIWNSENIFSPEDDCELEDILQRIDDDDF